MAGAVVISALSLFVLSVIFTIVYYRKISCAQKEYEEAKEVVSNIVQTFRLTQEKQKKKIANMSHTLEDVLAENKKLENALLTQKERYEQINTNINEVIRTNKKRVKNIAVLPEKMMFFSSNQKRMLEPKIKYTRNSLPKNKEQIKNLFIEKTNVLLKLTDTERNIVQILVNEGEKTAPEIQERIKKTREHAARLMRKLFENGYIDRETHKIPYVYRVNKKLLDKKRIRAEKQKAKSKKN